MYFRSERKKKKSDSSFLRVVAFRRIRLKKLQIVAGRAFFSHFTVSRSVSFNERGVYQRSFSDAFLENLALLWST